MSSPDNNDDVGLKRDNSSSVKIVNKKRRKSSSGDAATTTNDKTNNNNSNGKKKKKTKKKKVKSKKKDNVEANTNTRDYQLELIDYITKWNNKDTSSWKFNKILQTWALEYWMYKDKIDNTTFKMLIPYAASVQGQALERLSSKIMNVIANDGYINSAATTDTTSDNNEETNNVDKDAGDCENNKNEAIVAAAKIALKRALKLQHAIKDVIP